MACASQFVHAAMAYLRLYTAPRPDPAQLPDPSLPFLDVLDKFSESAPEFFTKQELRKNLILPPIDKDAIVLTKGVVNRGVTCHLNATLQALKTLESGGLALLNQNFPTTLATYFKNHTKVTDGENYKIYLKEDEGFSSTIYEESDDFGRRTKKRRVQIKTTGISIPFILKNSKNLDQIYTGPFSQENETYILVPKYHIDIEFNLNNIMINEHDRNKMIRFLNEFKDYSCDNQQQTADETFVMITESFVEMEQIIKLYAGHYIMWENTCEKHRLRKVHIANRDTMFGVILADGGEIDIVKKGDIKSLVRPKGVLTELCPETYIGITSNDNIDLLAADSNTRKKYFNTDNTTKIEKLLMMYHKNQSREHKRIEKSEKIYTASPFFIAYIKRGTQGGGKDSTKLFNHMEIELNTFEGPKKFNMISFIVHGGDTGGSGHYTNVSLRDKTWTYFDDGAKPKPLTDENAEIRAADAAMLFYQRVDAAA